MSTSRAREFLRLRATAPSGGIKTLACEVDISVWVRGTSQENLQPLKWMEMLLILHELHDFIIVLVP